MINNKREDVVVVENGVVESSNTALVEPMQINTFSRVNFMEPVTITRYGEDVLSTTVEAAQAFVEGFAIEDLIDPDFYQKVDALLGLPARIQKLAGKRNKPTGKLVKFAQGFLKLGDSKDKLSYSKLVDAQNASIDNVIEAEERMMEVNNAHFATNNAYIKAIKPFLPVLDEVIKLGEYDRDVFQKEVVLIEQQAKQNPNDQDIVREARLGRMLLDVFNARLAQLHKQRLALSQNIGEKEIQQSQIMQLQLSHSEFVTSDSYLLKIKGLSQISAELIREDAERQTYLSGRINEALVQNTNSQVQTTKDIVKLRSGGGNIKVDTLKKMSAGITQCVDILQKGAEIDRAFALQQAKEIPALVQVLEAKVEGLKENSITALIESAGEQPKFKVLGKTNRPAIGTESND